MIATVGFRYSLVSVVGAGVLCAMPIIGALAVKSASLRVVDVPTVVVAPLAALDVLPGSLYARVGLQDGDVVTRTHVSDSVLSVDFIRHGERGTLRVDLDRLPSLKNP